MSKGLDISTPVVFKKMNARWGEPEAAGAASSEEQRRVREKPPLSSHDGRVARGKGKNIPLNFRVTLELKERFLAQAAERGITMTDVLELAMDALEESGEGNT